MRSLILYTSNIGSTKAYAEKIANAVHGDVLPLKKYKWKDIESYDCIVYGGWILGGTISGIDDFLCHYEEMEGKDVILFSVGRGAATKESRQDLISRNLLDSYHVRYYQLQGNFDYSVLGFYHKAALKINSQKMDPEAAYELLHKPFYYDDVAGVQRIVQMIQGLEAKANYDKAHEQTE